jgi:ethanolamine utilization protein EutQ (cupin superfamily)
MSNRDLPLHIPHEDVTYQPRALSGSAQVQMGWSIPDEGESPLCAGFATWNGDESPFKTLDYDEILLVLEGSFGFELEDGQRFSGKPGDTLRIPRGTRVRYFGDSAKAFFVITPPTPLD